MVRTKQKAPTFGSTDLISSAEMICNEEIELSKVALNIQVPPLEEKLKNSELVLDSMIPMLEKPVVEQRIALILKKFVEHFKIPLEEIEKLRNDFMINNDTN